MATLFEQSAGAKAPEPKPAKPPAWVISELVQKWGCRPHEVRKWSRAQAYAVMYRYRDGVARRASAAQERRAALSAGLLLAASTDDFVTAELVELIAESLLNLDRAEVAEVARVTSALLKPPG